MAQYFYENNLVGIDYAEPYAGGAGLALRLLLEEYVGQIYINDYNPSIYAFWKMILKYPDDFCEWIMNVEVSVDNWYKYKQIQKDYSTADMMELAKSTFFLNRTNISGVIKGGIIGGLSQKGKYGITARFKKEELIEKIKMISRFADRIVVSNEDGILFARKIDRKQRRTFIYLDPPYYQKGADLYMNYFTDKDHIDLSNVVKKIKNPWLVSYDNQPFILDLYAQYQRVVYQLSQCASNRVGDEVLIFKNGQEYQHSIQCLKSPIMIQ
jgi:DNA adenine methylase